MSHINNKVKKKFFDKIKTTIIPNKLLAFKNKVVY